MVGVVLTGLPGAFIKGFLSGNDVLFKLIHLDEREGVDIWELSIRWAILGLILAIDSSCIHLLVLNVLSLIDFEI